MKRNIISVFFILVLFSCNSENQTPPKDGTPTEQSTSKTATTKTSKISNSGLSNREQMQVDLAELRKKLADQIETGMDATDVQKYLKDSEIYMNLYGDSLAAEHIFQAADFARGIGDYQNALEYWRVVYQAWEREKHPKVPHAIFSVAFTYENFLDRKDLAKKMYNQLLEKFPDHELAVETKKILKNFDKSPEELIKQFQKNQ